MDNHQKFYEVLHPGDEKKIHLASLRIVEEIGLCLPFQEALDLFDAAGAQVDFDRQTVRIPASLIEPKLNDLAVENNC